MLSEAVNTVVHDIGSVGTGPGEPQESRSGLEQLGIGGIGVDAEGRASIDKVCTSLNLRGNQQNLNLTWSYKPGSDSELMANQTAAPGVMRPSSRRAGRMDLAVVV